MSSKYNIALIPRYNAEEIIKLAQALSEMADRYLLGAHSLPHVTLYQFEANAADIQAIWNEVCQSVKPASLRLQFEKFSFITFDNINYWASLLPDQVERLKAMHSMVAAVIKRPIKTNYDPHLTLIRTKNPACMSLVNQLSKQYEIIHDDFVLSLGGSDEVGQFTKIIAVPANFTRWGILKGERDSPP